MIEQRLERTGELTAMLRVAGPSFPTYGGRGCERGPRRGAIGHDLCVGEVEMDAGTGFEPVTFRL